MSNLVCSLSFGWRAKRTVELSYAVARALGLVRQILAALLSVCHEAGCGFPERELLQVPVVMTALLLAFSLL